MGVISKTMNQLQIGNESDYCVVLDNPRLNDEGWVEYYDLHLRSEVMKASVKVENLPYAVAIWEFFKELDDHWSGWEGEKSWRALKDEFRLDVTISKTGHVNLCFQLNLYSYEWRAIANICIESGQLGQLSRSIHKFFRINANL
ncbi:DUF6228 family protein [Microbulbifer variabilis]|uniref:DUF6228 family protein n=1 Tax=Microbulbifer variabilis TaxID=266805 RepID=UPI0039A77542